MNNFKAIFFKQTASQLRSPALIIQAILFLGMMVVFSALAQDNDCEDCIPAIECAECAELAALRPNPSIGGMFTVMFVGMTLMGTASGLVAEDKTTNNLRFMTMAGVKPRHYLFGTFLSLIMITFFILPIFGLVSGYWALLPRFMAITFSGGFVSVLLGLALGLSKIPMLSFPISMVIGMAPMLSTFNDNMLVILQFLFTQRVNLAVSNLAEPMGQHFLIIGLNGLVALIFFIFMHRRGELRW